MSSSTSAPGLRPLVLNLRQGWCPHDVGEIVSLVVKLEPKGIAVELAARQPRPFDGVLALLDVLLR